MVPRLALLCCLLIFTGCGDPVAAKLAGKWDGEFEAAPKDAQTKMRPEWRYRGYLQLYATQHKFKMHLESTGQVVDVGGIWSMQGRQLKLDINEVLFDDRGGQIKRAPGIEPILPEVVREAYGRALMFNLDEAQRNLSGLDMTVGPLLGRHMFHKAQANARFQEQ